MKFKIKQKITIRNNYNKQSKALINKSKKILKSKGLFCINLDSIVSFNFRVTFVLLTTSISSFLFFFVLIRVFFWHLFRQFFSFDFHWTCYEFSSIQKHPFQDQQVLKLYHQLLFVILTNLIFCFDRLCNLLNPSQFMILTF